MCRFGSLTFTVFIFDLGLQKQKIHLNAACARAETEVFTLLHSCLQKKKASVVTM